MLSIDSYIIVVNVLIVIFRKTLQKYSESETWKNNGSKNGSEI